MTKSSRNRGTILRPERRCSFCGLGVERPRRQWLDTQGDVVSRGPEEAVMVGGPAGVFICTECVL